MNGHGDDRRPPLVAWTLDQIIEAGTAQAQIIEYARAVIDYPELDPFTVARVNAVVTASATGDLDATLAAIGDWIRAHDGGESDHPLTPYPVADRVVAVASIASLAEICAIVATMLNERGTARINGG